MEIIIDIETSGLNAMKDKISCISFYFEDEIKSFFGFDEKEILKKFSLFLHKLENIHFIGFNVDSFDIPFIIKRCIINNVRFLNKFKITDLRKTVNGFFYSYNKYEKGTLDEWSCILNGCKKETNGLEVVDAYNKGDFEKIKEHCEYDVKVTKKLLERCKEVGLL